MQSVAVVALALLESVQAFQAPVAPRAASKAVSMFSEGDLGVLPPLGVYDPLGLIETRDMRRYEIMEIKHGTCSELLPCSPNEPLSVCSVCVPPPVVCHAHLTHALSSSAGRAAMLGFVHVILIEAGVRFPGYLSTSAGLKFSDVPAGCFASLEALPTAGWLQIMLTTCMMETGYFLFEAQTEDKESGDIGGDSWVRYDDEETKTFKLNAERQNGRAAMLGITGCIFHELLGVDALYPTGGMGGAAPPTVF